MLLSIGAIGRSVMFLARPNHSRAAAIRRSALSQGDTSGATRLPSLIACPATGAETVKQRHNKCSAFFKVNMHLSDLKICTRRFPCHATSIKNFPYIMGAVFPGIEKSVPGGFRQPAAVQQIK
jgi:hypothetical protein